MFIDRVEASRLASFALEVHRSTPFGEVLGIG